MNDINFFEQYVQRKHSRFEGKETILLIIVGIIVISSIAYPIVNKIRISMMSKEIASIDREINSKENMKKEQNIEEMRKTVQDLKEKDKLLQVINNEFYKKDNIGDYLIRKITDSMNSDVFLNKIDIIENEINIDGISRNKESIANLERNLRDISYFKDIFIPEISLEDGFYKFSVKININSENIQEKEEGDKGENKDAIK